MLTRLRFSIFTVLFLHSPQSAASAQSQAPSAPNAPVTIRESVVVTATGRETPESKVGASITVLDRQDIEQRHALSTIDLLRTVPGVVAVRTGGVGNLTGLFVRGGESTYNKVLLDGMPLNEPGGAFNFASLSPENIERIEVLRGAHSALFGSDAMASVIQLFSVRPDTRRPQANITLDAGNYDTTHVAAGLGARTATIEYSVFGSRLQTDNREPNNENRTSTVSGSVTRCDDIGCLGAIPRPRRVRPHRHSRSHGVRPARHGRTFPASRRQLPRWMESADRIAHHAADQLFVHHHEISLNEPDSPTRLSRRGLGISLQRSRLPIFCSTPKRSWDGTISSTAPTELWRRTRR